MHPPPWSVYNWRPAWSPRTLYSVVVLPQSHGVSVHAEVTVHTVVVIILRVVAMWLPTTRDRSGQGSQVGFSE